MGRSELPNGLREGSYFFIRVSCVAPSDYLVDSFDPKLRHFHACFHILGPFTTPLDNSIEEAEAIYGFGNFAFTNKDADRVIDYEKLLTRTFYDNKNR